MHFFLLLLLFIINSSFISPFLSSTDEWQLKKQESGISVYTRTAENSSFKELKSQVQIKTSLSSIIALLNDWDSYPQWVYKCGKSNTIKKINETELIHYQTLIAPWPVDDRDFVVNVKLSQDAKTKTVYQKAVCIPDYIPKVDGHVRITEFKALWTITPLKNGMVNVEYQLLVDPGGNIPAWLVNLAVVDGPFETTFHLKEWVMKAKYQNAKFSYIKELE